MRDDEKQKFDKYIVQKEDNLSLIAKKLGIDGKELLKFHNENCIWGQHHDPYSLHEKGYILLPYGKYAEKENVVHEKEKIIAPLGYNNSLILRDFSQTIYSL